jgi:hypothetical protein
MKGNLNVYVSFFVGNIPAYGHISNKVCMIDSPMHLFQVEICFGRVAERCTFSFPFVAP